MICQHCQAENRPRTKYCRTCGEPMTAASSEPPPPIDKTMILPLRCPICGAANQASALSCAGCGTRLIDPVDPTPTTALPPIHDPEPAQGRDAGPETVPGVSGLDIPPEADDRTLVFPPPAPMAAGASMPEPEPAPATEPEPEASARTAEEVRAKIFAPAPPEPAPPPSRGPGVGVWIGAAVVALVLVVLGVVWMTSEPVVIPTVVTVETAPSPAASPALVEAPPPPQAASEPAPAAEPPPPEVREPVAEPAPAPKPKPAPRPATARKPKPPEPVVTPTVPVAPPKPAVAEAPPPPVQAPPPAPVVPAVPAWATALRDELAQCEAKGNFFTKAICAEQAKWRHCDPGDRWGKIPECTRPQRRAGEI